MSPTPPEKMSIFTDPAAYADDVSWHEQATLLREEQGIVRIEDTGFAPFWAVLRHADVAAVERHSALFHNAPHPILVDGAERDGGGPPVRNLVGMDGDEHREYRNIVAAWFRPGALGARAPEIELAVKARLDELASRNGETIEPPELVPYFVLLTAAGHDTVSTVLAGSIEALAQHPDQLELLKQDPSLIPNAIEEMARWVTPTKHFMRTAVSDTEVGGQRVATGDWLLMSYPSANRDSSVFESPFTFDVARADATDHLAYGAGPHFCIGAHLARLELRAFFEQFIPRLRSLELAGDVERAKTTFVATSSGCRCASS